MVKPMDFPGLMYRCESWTIKKAEYWRTGAFELWCWRRLLKFLRFLGSEEIKPVNPKGNHSWIFTEKTIAEAEDTILWPPDVKGQLIGKDPHAAEDWGQEEKWVTEDEKVGWHHWLNGHDSEQVPGDSEGQGTLVCFSPRGCKESDTT